MEFRIYFLKTMVKIKISLLLSLFLFFLYTPIFVQEVNADEFSIDYNIANTINTDLSLVTDYSVSVTNNLGKNFISKTKLKYPFDAEKYSVKANDNQKYDVLQEPGKDANGNYTFDVSLPTNLVAGAKFSYTLTFVTHAAVVHNTNIINATIPGLIETSGIKVKSSQLKISRDMPEVKYSTKTLVRDGGTKKLDDKDKNYTHYTLNTSDSVVIILGEKTKYNFTITVKSQDNTIYAPSISKKQKVIIDDISAPPKDSTLDNESNIILGFDVAPPIVIIKGKAEIETDKYQDSHNNVNMTDTFWKNDSRLYDIEKKIKAESITSQKVKLAFDYIASVSSYNDKLNAFKRLETNEILDSPKGLHSLNISDLAVAILKSSGVDTRLSAGFFDPQAKKSFTNNALHFWIQYYDSNFGGWKSADPTMHIIAPSDNYYDGIGVTHLEIFQSESGWKIPNPASYQIDATLEDGFITAVENFTTNLVTESVKSGKDNTIELMIQNNGNMIAKIETVSIDFEGNKIDTNVKKIVFPQQKSYVDVKIKNDNVYEDREVSLNATINTSRSTYGSILQLKFQKDGSLLWIPLLIFALIVVILLMVWRNAKKARKNHH